VSDNALPTVGGMAEKHSQMERDKNIVSNYCGKRFEDISMELLGGEV
jgi:hypothetical protein